jgi:hypothetical protein
MAHAHALEAETVMYHGAVWTDRRGYATVELPVAADALLPPLEYELRDLEPPSTARVTGELENGRFTIHTDEPHVKVAWRVIARRSQSPPKEER